MRSIAVVLPVRATLRRPPINEGQTTDAAWIILALQGETGLDAPPPQRAAV